MIQVAKSKITLIDSYRPLTLHKKLDMLSKECDPTLSIPDEKCDVTTNNKLARSREEILTDIYGKDEIIRNYTYIVLPNICMYNDDNNPYVYAGYALKVVKY